MDISRIPTNGVIFSWLMEAGNQGQEVSITDLANLKLEPTQSLWLHLNYSNSLVQNWLRSSNELPEDITEVICEDVGRVRQKTFTNAGSSQLIFFNDFEREFTGESSEEIATLWLININNIVITLRPHAIQSTDVLRTYLRNGRIRAQSTADIYRLLLDIREETLHQHANSLMDRMDQLEEVIIRGETLPEHETLGRIRIQCNRMRRYFSPELIAINHLIRRQPAWIDSENLEEITELTEKLSVLVQELNHLYERAKVLQDEQAAHIAEFNANNLHVLSVMTVIFLPMTLITGIMGMNMEDLPGLKGSFNEIALLMLLAGFLMFGFLKIKKII
jgi:zinc transporter